MSPIFRRSAFITFRRSAFSSALSLAFAAPLHTAFAADTETNVASNDTSAVPEIIVTADPLARAADELTQPVEILAADELDRQRGASIGETLERQLGVSTTDFGRGAGRPLIRGQGGPRVLVLSNGVPSMDASDVSTDHDVTIDPAHATQIEVLKGPATLIYGSAASAGVINVVDDRLPGSVTPGLSGEAGAGYGSNGDERFGSASVGYGFGESNDGTQLHADIAGRRAGDYDIPGYANADGTGSHGVLANSGTRKDSGSVSAAQFWDGGSLAASFSRVVSVYDLPVEETAFIDMSQSRWDIEGRLNNPLPGIVSLRLRSGYNDYEHVEFEAPGEPGTRFENQQSDTRLEAVHAAIAGWRGVFGVQYGHRDFSAIGEEAFVPPTISTGLGAFVVEERPVDWGKLEIGARVDRNESKPDDLPTRSFMPLSFSAGTTIDLSDDYHLKAYATRSQRSPVTEELYSFGPHGATETFERGNADLDMETANNFEIGIDKHAGRLQWRANVYYERINDYIFSQETDQGLNADGSGTASSDGIADRVDDEGNFDPNGELLLVRYRHANANFYGVEGEIGYALLQGPINLQGRLFGDAAYGELSGGDDLPRMTPMRFGLGLTADRGPLSGGLDLIRVAKQDRVAALETETDGYTLLNADLAYTLPLASANTSIYLRGRNLLDEEARRSTSFIKDEAPLPGASVIVGFEVKLL